MSLHSAPQLQLYQLTRFTSAALPSAAITVGLYLVMLALIANDAVELEDAPGSLGPVVMEPPEPPKIIKEPQPQRPAEPLKTPAWQPPADTVESNPQYAHAGPTSGIQLGPVEISGGNSGAGIVAYLKVQPVYPPRALSRGIEGFVDLAFDITAAGNTTNIRILAAQPQGVFEKAARAALRKWKYKVPVVDGVGRGQEDMMTRISFALEKD